MIWKLRHAMTGDALDLTDQFIKALRKSKDNEAFFEDFTDKTIVQTRNTRGPHR